MSLRTLGAAALALTLAACGSAPDDMAHRRATATYSDPLPPMRSFNPATPRASVRTNTQLAGDFLQLTFELESGREVPRLTRYDGPVVVELRGPASATLQRDLSRLVSRLRREAGVPISVAGAGQQGNLVVEVLTRKDLQRVVPQAACFVVPRVRGWEEFRKERRTDKVDWTTLERREMASVFLPGDVSPQEARDCLHEEIAQALGPLNDLYRLPDSVFNDDNFHTVLTGFDMLMLRVTYDPALTNGMGKSQVAAALPGILARLNPGGQRSGPQASPATPRIWVEAIEDALGPRGSDVQRRKSAARAVELARSAGWRDTRMAFSLYALGRLSLHHEPELALGAFLEAANIYNALPDTQIQSAHVAMQLAAFSLSAGQAGATINFVDDSIPAVRAAENAALLSTLMLMRAEALEMQGQLSQARAERTEALGWARYGFGAEDLVRGRAGEIAALAPGPGDR
ncbi:Protein of unknown function (DUF2927) [Aliiruegeria haliotis]|uniref:DUF2927 family protein n=1 Tax=Aliiruegeria haliotis TaxID=1280846 RepID=A0A2T0RJY1_9RHOB|nr:DUF2927 domain-containing protein [Aliiruegeria haliotis]PRY21441.1 Protein of unknown function (DUF2927) [Aliiruegeria haliotis]